MTMNIATEPKLSGRPIDEKSRTRPVRMVRWFIVVGLALALLVGGLVGFNAFRSHMIAQFFANNKPPPTNVSVVEAKSEVIPNLLTAVGELAAVHQVNVMSDVNGRITDIMFTAGSHVKAGTPLVQLFDGPDQGDLRRRAWRAQGRGRAVSDGRHADGLADRSVRALCELHRDRERLRPTEGGPDRPHRGRRLSWPNVRGQDHHHRAADRDRYAQHSRVGDDRQPRSHPQAR